MEPENRPESSNPEAAKRKRRPRNKKPTAEDGTASGETPTPELPAKEAKKEAKPSQAEGADAKPKKQYKAKEAKPAEGEKAEGEESPTKAPRKRRPKTASTEKVEGAEEETEKPEANGEDGEKKPRQRKRRPKKDAAEGEEDADAKPETTGPKYRAKTAKKDDEADEEETKAGDEDGTEKKGGAKGKRNGKKDQDKDNKEEKKKEKNLVYQNPMDFKETRKFKSKWEEYRYGDWRRQRSNTYVTLETVIPEMPAKPLKQPDEEAHQKKLKEIQDKIKEIGKSLDEKKTQFEDTLQQKIHSQKAGESGQGYSKEIGVKLKLVNDLKKRKAEIHNAQDKAIEGQPELMARKQQLVKKIDSEYDREELIEKGLRRIAKQLERQVNSSKEEANLIRRKQFIKDSLPYIQEKEAIDAKIKIQNANRREEGKELSSIKAEIATNVKEVEEMRKSLEAKSEVREDFDKQLDKINEKRKKERDERDKLYKQKDQLKDAYYSELIEFNKEQYLIKDIEWMKGVQEQVKVREAERAQKKAEYEVRVERRRQEAEEKERIKQERIQKEIDRKEREAAQIKEKEERALQDEIDKLKQITNAIEDTSVGSSQFFEQIELCESLQRYCQRHLKSDAPEEEKKQSETKKSQPSGSVQSALNKEKLIAAPAKGEEDVGAFGQLKTTKKGGQRRKNTQDEQQSGMPDFGTIKRFSSLKLIAPTKEEDFERLIKELSQLKDALVYWGNIMHRLNKIKFIQNSKKLIEIDEYKQMEKDEQSYVLSEKAKFLEDDALEKTGISPEMLKIAQQIDKEVIRAKAWEDDDSDAEESDDSENPNLPTDKRKAKTAKPVKKIAQQKFREIIKATEAFPTLDNPDDYDEEEEGAESMDNEGVPTGEIADE